jgi:hypothetical protein
MVKWYELTYLNEYNIERAHTFSGNRETLRMVLDHWRIDPANVLSFSINDEEADLASYMGGEQ